MGLLCRRARRIGRRAHGLDLGLQEVLDLVHPRRGTAQRLGHGVGLQPDFLAQRSQTVAGALGRFLGLPGTVRQRAGDRGDAAFGRVRGGIELVAMLGQNVAQLSRPPGRRVKRAGHGVAVGRHGVADFARVDRGVGARFLDALGLTAHGLGNPLGLV